MPQHTLGVASQQGAAQASPPMRADHDQIAVRVAGLLHDRVRHAAFRALKEIGYQGYISYEMCEVLDGGGSIENLDRTAKKFLDYVWRFDDHRKTQGLSAR